MHYKFFIMHYLKPLNPINMFKIGLVTISNKYVKYLSESPEINSLGPDTCSGHGISISGDPDKYSKYLLLIVTRLINQMCHNKQ